MFVSSTLLGNLRSVNLAVLRPYPRFHQRRNFSFSPRPQAAEISDDFLANFKNTTFFRKIADKPEALSALVSFAKLLQEQGVDITASKPPSALQMLRMAANPQFREAAQRVAVELQKAGIELNSQEAMEELMNLKKDLR